MSRVKDLPFTARLSFMSLWLFVFSIPWEDTVVLPGFGTATRVLGLLAFAAGCLALMERGHLTWPNGSFWCFSLFVLWSNWTLVWSVAPDLTAARVQTYLQLLCLIFLISQFGSGSPAVARLVDAYLAGTCVSSLYTISQFVLQRQSMYQRYAAAGFDPNDLGIILAISLPFAYLLSTSATGWRVWFYRLQLMTGLMAILLTGSRAAALTTLVAMLIIPFTFTRLSLKARVRTALAAVSLALIAVSFIPETSWRRLGTLTTEATQGSMGSRRDIWAAGFDVFMAHPFGGAGAGAFPESVTSALGVAKVGRYVAHNTFLSVLVETGLIGMLLFILLIGNIATHLLATRTPVRIAWTFALISLAVGINSVTWEHRKPFWIFLTLCSADCPVTAYSLFRSKACFSERRRSGLSSGRDYSVRSSDRTPARRRAFHHAC